jgi:hypothetical protein
VNIASLMKSASVDGTDTSTATASGMSKPTYQQFGGTASSGGGNGGGNEGGSGSGNVNDARNAVLSVVICIDMCQACFTMTGIGIPFNIHTRGMREVISALADVAKASMYAIQNIYVGIIAHRPEINATFSLWRGVIHANSNVDWLLDVLDSKIRYVEEEAVSQQMQHNKRRGLSCLFPSMNTYAQAIKDTFDTFPMVTNLRAILLTSGTMHINVAFVQERLSRHKLQLHLLVESCKVRRAVNVHQSMFDLHALAASTNGYIDTFEGDSAAQIVDSLKGAVQRLLSPKFFRSTAENSFPTAVENDASLKRLQTTLAGTSSVLPRATEKLLNSYEIDGGAVNHYIAYRIQEGFQVVDIIYEPVYAGMDSSRSVRYSDSFVNQRHTATAWNVTFQLEKILSSVSILVYDFNFRMNNPRPNTRASMTSSLKLSSFKSPFKSRQDDHLQGKAKPVLASIMDAVADPHWVKNSINVSVRYICYQYGFNGMEILHTRDKASPASQGIYEFDKRISLMMSMLLRNEPAETPRDGSLSSRSTSSSSAKELSMYSDVVEKLATLDEVSVVHVLLCNGFNEFSLTGLKQSTSTPCCNSIINPSVQMQLCGEIRDHLVTCESMHRLSDLKWLFVTAESVPLPKSTASKLEIPRVPSKHVAAVAAESPSISCASLTAIVVEIIVTKAIFITIKVQIVTARSRYQHKRCAGIPSVIIELLKGLNCRPIVLKSDLSKYCMPNWFGCRISTVGNSLLRNLSNTVLSSSSPAMSLVVPTESTGSASNGLLQDGGDIITSNLSNFDKYFDIDLEATTCASYRSLLQTCYRPTSLKSGDVEQINVVITELVSAKVEVGYHVVHYHVSRSADGNYSAFISLVAVGAQDPSGFQLDCLIQCNIHCLSENNKYSFGIGYCWPKCFNDGLCAADEDEISVGDQTIRLIENYVRRSQSQDEKIFSFYSVLLPILCTTERGLFGAGTPASVQTPRSATSAKSTTDTMALSTFRYNRLHYPDWANLQSLSCESSLELPIYSSSGDASVSACPVADVAATIDTQNAELLRQLHMSLTQRDEIFLPLYVENTLQGCVEKLYALVIDNCVLFILVPTNYTENAEYFDPKLEPVGLDIDGDNDRTDGTAQTVTDMKPRGTAIYITIKALTLPLRKFRFDNDESSFVLSQVEYGGVDVRGTVHDCCDPAKEFRLEANVEACKMRVRELFMRNYVCILYDAAQRGVQFTRSDISLAMEHCKVITSRADVSNMIKKRMSLAALETGNQLTNFFRETVGKLVKTISPCVVFVQSVEATADASVCGWALSVLFIKFSLLYRWEEVDFSVLPLSACPSRFAQQIEQFCLNAADSKLLDMGEILLETEILYLPKVSTSPDAHTAHSKVSNISSSHLLDMDGRELSARRWSFSQKGVRRPSGSFDFSTDKTESVPSLPTMSTDPVNVFRDQLSSEINSLTAMDTLNSLHQLISLNSPDPMSLNLARQCVSFLRGKHQQDVRFDFFYYQSAVQRSQPSAAGSNKSHSLHTIFHSSTDTETNELIISFMNEMQRLQGGFSNVISFEDNFISVTREWKNVTACKSGAVPDVDGGNTAAAADADTVSCWILLTASNDVVIRSGPPSSNVDDVSSCRQLQFNILLWCPCQDTATENTDNTETCSESSQQMRTEILLQSLLDEMEVCWRRVNQKYLLLRLYETFNASQYLLVPPATNVSTAAKDKISPRVRPPINIKPRGPGKIESVVTSPRDSQPGQADASHQTGVDVTASRCNILVNNGKKIEPGCFSCSRQGEVVCDMFHSARGSHDAIVHTLESQALSQFVVVNNERYFVSQDMRGNYFYMSFDQQLDRDAKTVKLGLYGLCVPDPTFLLQLKEFLDPRLVEIEAKAISASLVTKNVLNITSHVSFMKQASPSKHVAVKVPLPCFVQDAYLFCSIMRQFLLQLQFITPLSVYSPSPSTAANISASGSLTTSDAAITRQMRHQSEVIHPACFGHNLFLRPAKPSAPTVVEPKAVAESPTVPFVPLTLRKLTRNVHVMSSSNDLSSMQATSDGFSEERRMQARKDVGNGSKCGGLERTISPIFFGVAEDSQRSRMAQCCDESAMLWQQNEFTFVYNNIPLGTAGGGVTRGSIEKTNVQQTARASTVSGTKPIGFGLAMLECFPVVFGSKTKIDLGKNFKEDTSSSQIPCAPTKLILATGSISTLATDVDGLISFIHSGQTLSTKYIPLTEGAKQIIEARVPMREFSQSSGGSEPIIQLQLNDLLRSVSGSDASSDSSNVEFHLRIYPTIPMQVKLLLDVCRMCIDQALIVYCMERLYCIPRLLSAVGASFSDKSPSVTPKCSPPDPQRLSTAQGTSSLQSARNAPMSPRLLSADDANVFTANFVESAGRSQIPPWLRTLILCHDFVHITRSLNKFSLASCLEAISFPCVLPKKQALQLKGLICDEFLKTYPSLKLCRSDTFCEAVFETDVRPAYRDLNSLYSRLTEGELDYPFGSHAFNLETAAPRPDFVRKLSKWNEFGKCEGKDSNYTIFGSPFISDVPTTATTKLGEGVRTPRSESVGGRSDGKMLVGDTDCVLPLWTRNRKYSIEIIVNTRGLYVFAFNVQPSIFASLRDICKISQMKCSADFLARGESYLSCLNIPRSTGLLRNYALSEDPTIFLASSETGKHSVGEGSKLALIEGHNKATADTTADGLYSADDAGKKLFVSKRLEVLGQFLVGKFSWELRTTRKLQQTLTDTSPTKSSQHGMLKLNDVPVHVWQRGRVLETYCLTVLCDALLSSVSLSAIEGPRPVLAPFHCFVYLVNRMKAVTYCEVVGNVSEGHQFYILSMPRCSHLHVTELCCVDGCVIVVSRVLHIDELHTDVIIEHCRHNRKLSTAQILSSRSSDVLDGIQERISDSVMSSHMVPKHNGDTEILDIFPSHKDLRKELARIRFEASSTIGSINVLQQAQLDYSDDRLEMFATQRCIYDPGHPNEDAKQTEGLEDDRLFTYPVVALLRDELPCQQLLYILDCLENNVAVFAGLSSSGRNILDVCRSSLTATSHHRFYLVDGCLEGVSESLMNFRSSESINYTSTDITAPSSADLLDSALKNCVSLDECDLIPLSHSTDGMQLFGLDGMMMGMLQFTVALSVPLFSSSSVEDTLDVTAIDMTRVAESDQELSYQSCSDRSGLAGYPAGSFPSTQPYEIGNIVGRGFALVYIDAERPQELKVCILIEQFGEEDICAYNSPARTRASVITSARSNFSQGDSRFPSPAGYSSSQPCQIIVSSVIQSGYQPIEAAANDVKLQLRTLLLAARKVYFDKRAWELICSGKGALWESCAAESQIEQYVEQNALLHNLINMVTERGKVIELHFLNKLKAGVINLVEKSGSNLLLASLRRYFPGTYAYDAGEALNIFVLGPSCCYFLYRMVISIESCAFELVERMDTTNPMMVVDHAKLVCSPATQTVHNQQEIMITLIVRAIVQIL